MLAVKNSMKRLPAFGLGANSHRQRQGVCDEEKVLGHD
jgi:hypothetical protein